MANEMKYNYEYLNAIKSSVSDIKELSPKAKRIFDIEGRQTVLFFDEIHRFNKLQQGLHLLPGYDLKYNAIGGNRKSLLLVLTMLCYLDV